MTECLFHTQVVQPVAYTARLVRKALRQQQPLVVLANAPTLDHLSQSIWALGDEAFLPHCRADAPPEVLARSLVWLADDLTMVTPRGWLVHLGHQVAPGFERFERLIEVVGDETAQVEAARARWRYYEERGYPLHHIKAAAAA
jgi:DNA polymerase-3 subunit chi